VIDLSPLYEYLKGKGYVRERQWIMIEGVPVDVFPADPLEKEAVEQAQGVEYEGVRTKVIIPEYLIALFLRAGRDKDLRKIEMLLGDLMAGIQTLISQFISPRKRRKTEYGGR